MDDAQRKIEQDEKSVYVENGNVTVNYASGKKIPKHLGTLPIIPDVFLGRDADLTIVHDKLFAGNNLLLLVNGEGGIGKTTFAAKYYHTYADEYTHSAWVFAENSIRDALLTLATALHLDLKNMTDDERLHELLRALADLKKPCLLVIDNANTLTDLEAHYYALHSCSNFHLLLTTRITEFDGAKPYPINALDEENAIELFKSHYLAHNPAENELLKEILMAVGYNTLVIELLAKNLCKLNQLRPRYSLASLLTDLQEKGLFGLSQSAEVSTPYHSNSLRKEKPEDILAAIYNLSELEDNEKALLSIFAVLPAEPIAFDVLDELLPNMESFENALTALATKGWIEHNDTSKTFKCSPVVQETTCQQNSDRLFDDCKSLIDTLIKKLGHEHHKKDFAQITYNETIPYSHYAEHLLLHIKEVNEKVAHLAERTGNFHTTTGNLEKTLFFYEKYHDLSQELYDADPQNIDLKTGLALSYRKLGNIYNKLGELKETLKNYEKYNEFSKEIYDTNPQDIRFINALAISYEKIGDIYILLGNLNQALVFYKQRHKLSRNNYEKTPHAISFKKSLAISYKKLGHIFIKLETPNKSQTCYEKYHELSKDLYNAEPQNVSYKNDLANSYEKLGSIYKKLWLFQETLTYYKKYNELSKEFYDADPQNIRYKNNLANSLKKLGDIYVVFGDLEKGLSFYESGFALSEELYNIDSRNVHFKEGCALFYSKLGKIHTFIGNLDEARSFYENRNKLSQELYDINPQNISFKREISFSYKELGDIYEKLETPNNSRIYYEKYHELNKELYNADPQNASYKNDLAISYEKLGEIYMFFGDFEKALLFFDKEHFLFNELYLYEEYSQNINFKNGIAVCYEKLGDAHSAIGNIKNALTAYEQSSQLIKELYEAYPNKFSVKKGLAILYAKLGSFYKDHRSDVVTACNYFQQAEALWAELTKTAPGFVEFQRNLSAIRKILNELPQS